MACYIYCIIKNTASPGIDSIRGIGDEDLRLINFRDLAAIVSNTPLINFDRLKKEELLEKVAVHQRVNEAVMKDCDIVPLAFGTIAENEQDVKRILSKAYLQFKTALSKIAGKVEFAVQAFWDENSILEKLAETNPEIQKLKKQVQTGGKLFGKAAKIKLGKLVFEAMESQKEAYLKDIRDFLKDSSLKSCQGKLVDKTMIMNTSYLIDKNRESELDERMNILGEKYEGKLRFKYVGPMSPYSFCNINLNLGNFELVDNARKTLRLPEVATFPEIKKKYLELASQYHPDKTKGSESQGKFKEASEAYRILENYCRNFRTDFDENDGNFLYSFKEEDVRDSIIINS